MKWLDFSLCMHVLALGALYKWRSSWNCVLILFVCPDWMTVILMWMTLNKSSNKATRSPEISRQQVQKLTPQFFLFIGYRFPLSLSTIVFSKQKNIFVFYSQNFFFSRNVGNSIKCKTNITPPPNHPHIWHVWDQKSEQGNRGLYWI